MKTLGWEWFTSKCESKPVLCCLPWWGCGPDKNNVFLFRVSLLSAQAWWGGDGGTLYSCVVNIIAVMLLTGVARLLQERRRCSPTSRHTGQQFARPAGCRVQYRVCINYPGTLLINILGGWSLTHGLPLAAPRMVSWAKRWWWSAELAWSAPGSLGGRYLLYPLSPIRQTIVFSPWSSWVINSCVRDPRCPILNLPFIRLWPLCNSGKPRSAIISVGCRPGRPLHWAAPDQLDDEDRSQADKMIWVLAEGGVMWTGSMPTKIVTITIRVTVSHQRLSVETDRRTRQRQGGMRSEGGARSWHLDKTLSQQIHVQTVSQVSGHNADGRCRFRSG